jgi:hypothetical protein
MGYDNYLALRKHKKVVDKNRAFGWTWMGGNRVVFTAIQKVDIRVSGVGVIYKYIDICRYLYHEQSHTHKQIYE